MKKLGIIVASGTFLMLLLGIVYSYSIFRLEIEEVFGVTHVASGVPYMLVLFFYAVFMLVGGILYTKFNTLRVAALGVFLIVIGYYLSSYANSIVFLSITYGVLVGSGIGILYLLPLRIISQTNSNNIGFMTGISLLGFGLSPLIFAPIINYMISSYSLSNTFLVLSLVFVILISPVAYFMAKQDIQEKKEANLTYKIVKERNFYVVYILFFIGTFVGLTFIGLTGTLGKELHLLTTDQIAIYLGVFAVFNGIGRPLYGFINDKIGFTKSAVISFSTIFLVAILQFFIDSKILFVVGFIVFYINFGGWLSLAPAATRKLFGSEDYSKNYGLVFTAYGLGAIIGTLSAGIIAENISFHAIFLMMAGITLLGIVIAIVLNPEKKDI